MKYVVSLETQFQLKTAHLQLGGGVTQTLTVLYKDLSKKYENLLLEYRAGSSVAGHAILGPYAPGADGITRNNTDHRSGGYFNY